MGLSWAFLGLSWALFGLSWALLALLLAKSTKMGRRWAKMGPTWFKMGQKPAGEQDKRIARPVSRQRVDPAAHAFRHAASAVQTPLPISLRRSPITSTLLVEYSNLGVRTPGFQKIAPLSHGIAVFSGKYTFTRGVGGFGGSCGGPWGEGWGHTGEGSAALGELGFRCASHPC